MKLKSFLFICACLISAAPVSSIAASKGTEAPKVVVKKLNVNLATLSQLQQIKGLGRKKAQAIIDYRNRKGKITSMKELLLVKGIGKKLLLKLEQKLSIQY